MEKSKKIMKEITFRFAVLLFLINSSSCSSQVKPIKYGKDECYFCKMIIVDQKFGVEIVSKKGKIFKFDDLGCAKHIVKGDVLKKEEIEEVFVNNYLKPGEMLNLEKITLVITDSLGSPMGGNMAAFDTKAAAINYINSKGGKIISNKVFESVK